MFFVFLALSQLLGTNSYKTLSETNSEQTHNKKLEKR